MLPEPPEVPHLMETKAGWALVPTLSGGSKDDSAWEQETQQFVLRKVPGLEARRCCAASGKAGARNSHGKHLISPPHFTGWKNEAQGVSRNSAS